MLELHGNVLLKEERHEQYRFDAGIDAIVTINTAFAILLSCYHLKLQRAQ